MNSTVRGRTEGSVTRYFGNGTTAIYAALRALGCSEQFVALPANICPSVIAAIRESSNRPLFVDIERDSYGLAPDRLAGVIGEVGAVIAVHAFGIPCQIAGLAALCRTHGIPLIEDCALAEGACVQGIPVGNFGDVAIFSYGAGKIFSLGEGGASQTRDRSLAKKLEAEHSFLRVGAQTKASEGLDVFFKFIYNNFYPDDLECVRRAFTVYLEDNGSALLRGFDERLRERIAQGLRSLQENVAARHAKCQRYEALLDRQPGLKLMRFPAEAAPWRFNLLVEPALRDRLLRTLLRERFRVSSWYTDISSFLHADAYRATDLTNSRWLSDRILNLWVDADTTDNEIESVSRRILDLVRNE